MVAMRRIIVPLVVLVLGSVAGAGAAAELETVGHLTVEQWSDADFAPEDLRAEKSWALAMSANLVEALAAQAGEDTPSAGTQALHEWLRDGLWQGEPSTWPSIYDRFVETYGEALVNEMLARVALKGGTASRTNQPTRVPSSWLLSVVTWSMHQPAMDITKTHVSGSLFVLAGDHQEIHGAIKVSREVYEGSECGSGYNGDFPVCQAFASARDRLGRPAECQTVFTERGCDDGGSIGKAVVRITIQDIDQLGSPVPGTLQFVDTQKTTECASATCCGVDHNDDGIPRPLIDSRRSP